MAALPKLLSVTSSGLTIVTTAYTSGDVLGVQYTIASCAQAAAGTGTIYSALSLDEGDVMAASQLYIFDTTTTPAADNSPWAPTDAEMRTLVGIINFPPGDDVGGSRISFTQCQIPYQCAAASTSLFVVHVTRSANAVFTAVGDLKYRLMVVED